MLTKQHFKRCQGGQFSDISLGAVLGLAIPSYRNDNSRNLELNGISISISIYSEDDKPTILGEAEVKMAEVKKRYWFPLAAELKGEDHFRFLRAYTGGA